jgi:hypothetical protein
MLPQNREIQDLDRESYRIVGMICAETFPEADVQAAIESLRRRTSEVFPDDPRVFERIYARRFSRLRTRFRPAPGLFRPVVG